MISSLWFRTPSNTFGQSSNLFELRSSDISKVFNTLRPKYRPLHTLRADPKCSDPLKRTQLLRHTERHWKTLSDTKTHSDLLTHIGYKKTLKPTYRPWHTLWANPKHSDPLKRTQLLRHTERHWEALRGTQWHSITLRPASAQLGTQRHSDPLVDAHTHTQTHTAPQKHWETLRDTERHSVTLEYTQTCSSTLGNTKTLRPTYRPWGTL
jgi:hypothetical protein